MQLNVDGQPVESFSGDTVLSALLRTGIHPRSRGCLCFAGDCGNCLVAADDVAYVRACQTAAADGLNVALEHQPGRALPLFRETDRSAAPVATRHRHCDVVVVGLGKSGWRELQRALDAGADAFGLDAAAGEEVIGIYPGPLVVARTEDGMLYAHPRREIVVATGSMEIQPVVPGSTLQGIFTAKAASTAVAAGIDLGRVATVGAVANGVSGQHAPGELLRFQGDERVEAVITRDERGEHRRECESAVVSLGRTPRDVLVRMGTGLPVRAVGSVASEGDLPVCPAAGVVCPCSGVEVRDLEHVWDHGFRDLELVKRATLAGTGTCQGATCVPYLRSFLQQRGDVLQPAFTARPVSRQLTFAEVAAGSHHRATLRTPLDQEHRALGATMERSGGWWRPWRYQDPDAEYWAIREAVSIGDVSTLGKFRVSGPDALRLLERLYPVRIAALKPGRCRYVLMLDERGYVIDDGLVCRESKTRFRLTFTTAGSTFAELWIRDWIDALALNVRLLNETASLGAINVTGPLAPVVLGAAGATDLPESMRFQLQKIAGIDCTVMRLSFTGELSFELHHAAKDSVDLWRRLVELGQNHGLKPHGLETLLKVRLEKGHIVVGQDTDYDSTPRRIDHEWAVKLEKTGFVGKSALVRTNKIELDRQLVGLEMDGAAPNEGAVIWYRSEYAGTVTSSLASPKLGKSIMLGWLRRFDGRLPSPLTIHGRPATRVKPPFYDPAGARARAAVHVVSDSRSWPETQAGMEIPGTQFVRLTGSRIVADPAALDRYSKQRHSGLEILLLRFAPDELFVNRLVQSTEIEDPHAIVAPESGFAGVWLPADEIMRFLEQECDWELPGERPAFVQGAVAELPVKLWFGNEAVLLLTHAALARELEERLR